MRIHTAQRCSQGCALALCIGQALGCGSRTPLNVEPGDPDVPIADAGSEEEATVAGCFTDSRTISEIPIDLYFAVDKSLSMNTIDRGSTVSRWVAVSTAMETLLKSPISAGLGAGISFFPRGAAGETLCSAADYAFPVVPISMLPGVAPSIAAAIGAQILGTGTPTTAALEGAHIYARTEQALHGSRVAAVVLVTDGLPRSCANTIASTTGVATLALAGSPPIKTYVLGVGPSLTNLNAVAQAGGTEQAYLVESSGVAALTAALEAIRTSALSCEYVLPVSGKLPPLDLARIHTRTGPTGAPTETPEVASAEACGDSPGWFYDNPPSAGGPPPTKILLCPASCDAVVHTSDSHLDVALGCAGDGS